MQPVVPTTIDQQMMPTSDLSWLPIEPLETVKAQQSVLARSEVFDLTESIGARIERRAIAAPHKVALMDDTQCFTYAELVAAFSEVASFVETVVLRPKTVIAVSGQRNAASVIAFLAIEKVDGIYLPIDENWPELRIRDILGRSGAACVIVNKTSLASKNLVAAAAALHCRLVSVAEALSAGKARRVHPLQIRQPLDPTSPRYVLYTSGSTGLPKGAIVEHQGMMNHLLSKVLELQISESDCVAQTASLTFDVSIWQMLAALLAGGRVCVLNDEDVLSPERMIDAVASKSITILEVVPTILSLLLDENERRVNSALEDLRYLVATGEALPPSTAERWISALPKVPIVNAYGPTECSDDVTHEFISLPQMGQIHTPIGRPIPNSRLYLLVEENGSFRSCKEGEPGELFVGGICVGRGYLGDPERTRAAFFRDPFVADESARLYRTGDRVRLTPFGSLEFLGRIDRQVKVGGVRVELGEIEETLRRHEAVTGAAVVVLGKSESNDRARLIAYVTGVRVEPVIVRAFVSDMLPRSMVPSEILVVTELPLTAHGKIDYRQLETIAHRNYSKGAKRPLPVIHAHSVLLHNLSEMRRQGLGAGMRALHVGSNADVALQTLLGVTSGMTQVLTTASSSVDVRAVGEQCRSENVSLLSISGILSGVLSPAEAASLRRQLSHLWVDRDHAEGTASLITALSGDRESPQIQLRYDAEAAIGAMSYEVAAERTHFD